MQMMGVCQSCSFVAFERPGSLFNTYIKGLKGDRITRLILRVISRDHGIGYMLHWDFRVNSSAI